MFPAAVVHKCVAVDSVASGDIAQGCRIGAVHDDVFADSVAGAQKPDTDCAAVDDIVFNQCTGPADCKRFTGTGGSGHGHSADRDIVGRNGDSRISRMTGNIQNR